MTGLEHHPCFGKKKTTTIYGKPVNHLFAFLKKCCFPRHVLSYVTETKGSVIVPDGYLIPEQETGAADEFVAWLHQEQPQGSCVHDDDTANEDDDHPRFVRYTDCKVDAGTIQLLEF